MLKYLILEFFLWTPFVNIWLLFDSLFLINLFCKFYVKYNVIYNLGKIQPVPRNNFGVSDSISLRKKFSFNLRTYDQQQIFFQSLFVDIKHIFNWYFIKVHVNWDSL